MPRSLSKHCSTRLGSTCTFHTRAMWSFLAVHSLFLTTIHTLQHKQDGGHCIVLLLPQSNNRCMPRPKTSRSMCQFFHPSCPRPAPLPGVAVARRSSPLCRDCLDGLHVLCLKVEGEHALVIRHVVCIARAHNYARHLRMPSLFCHAAARITAPVLPIARYAALCPVVHHMLACRRKPCMPALVYLA